MFNKEEWPDRLSENPRRRTLTNVLTQESVVYDVVRTEGNISQEGKAFSQENMEGLEDRIEAETNLIEKALAPQHYATKAKSTIHKGEYFIKGATSGQIFCRAKVDIPNGTSFGSNNCEELDVGTVLKQLNDSIGNTNTRISSLTTDVNGSLTRLNNEMSYGFSVRPRGKFFSFGSNLVFSGGLATVTLDCSDTLTTRANGVTVTLGGRSDEFLVGSLTEAATTRVGVAIHTVRNTSYSGTFLEVGVIVWGY